MRFFKDHPKEIEAGGFGGDFPPPFKPAVAAAAWPSKAQEVKEPKPSSEEKGSEQVSTLLLPDCQIVCSSLSGDVWFTCLHIATMPKRSMFDTIYHLSGRMFTNADLCEGAQVLVYEGSGLERQHAFCP